MRWFHDLTTKRRKDHDLMCSSASFRVLIVKKKLPLSICASAMTYVQVIIKSYRGIDDNTTVAGVDGNYHLVIHNALLFPATGRRKRRMWTRHVGYALGIDLCWNIAIVMAIVRYWRLNTILYCLTSGKKRREDSLLHIPLSHTVCRKHRLPMLFAATAVARRKSCQTPRRPWS